MSDILNDALQESVLTSELDDIVAYFIVDMCHTGDEEIDHIRADQALLTLLENLGYTHTIEEYNKVSKWHA